MKRRQIVKAVGGVMACAWAFGVNAQPAAFPSKPIRIIVGSAPGALLDVASRLYAERMSVYLKQPVVVENMQGASSTVAARYVAKAAPDGHTLMAVANTVVTMPHLVKNAGYVFSKDFVAVGEMCRSAGILVASGTSPLKSVPDLVAAAKKRPGELTFGSGGQGTTSHLPMEMFLKESGLSLSHVPYKGVAQALPDVISGRVNVMMGTATSFMGSLNAGTLKALAITSDVRSPKFPNLPTFKELGYPGATYSIFVGLVAPSGLPDAVRSKLAAAMEVARNDKALQARLDNIDQDISDVRTPEQFQNYLKAEEARSVALIRAANITAE